ncbi:hypothetical protein SEA_SCENTAE_124 [Gordonia phage SCentae]|nr:hypothetical protein SEA_SCENTAE_124 [Gordonia phage SCentae]
MSETQHLQFDSLPGVDIVATRGHEEYGEDFITFECFRDGELIKGANGGFNGPGAPLPTPPPVESVGDVPVYADPEGQ